MTTPKEEIENTPCCSVEKCDCDDGCVDQLARAICASDDNHIHPEGFDSTSVTIMGDDEGMDKSSLTASETCHCEDTTLDVPVEQDTTAINVAAPAATQDVPVVHACGLPKRADKHPRTRSKLPKTACGGHQSLARRQMETLASFGCICKAMIARGLQSCCSTKLSDVGRAVLSSGARSRRTSSIKSQLSNSCAASCCNDKASIRSFPLQLPKDPSKISVVPSHCGDPCCDEKEDAEKKSVCGGSCCGKDETEEQPCCDDSCCGGKEKAEENADCGDSCCGRSPAASRVSVDSCCKNSCCDKSIHSGLERDVEKVDKLGDAIVELSADSSSLAHAILAVSGMTCTGCENKLIRVLQALPDVCNVKVSLVLTRAEFDYRGTVQDLQVLIHKIEERTGFSIEQTGLTSQRTLDMKVSPALLEKLIITPTLDGILDTIKVDKHTVRVTFDPHIIGARTVLESYSDYSVTLAAEPRDPMLTAGMQHIRAMFIRTILSALLTVPVLIMTWAPLPDHHKAYSIASLVLASIVQTCIAGPFYSAALRSLLFSGIVETDLLIVLSTTTAYVYSVVAFAYDMIGKPLAQGEFFETSTLLVTLIMIGQLISAFARHRAIEAISLRSLQDNHATLLHPGGKEERIDGRLLHFGDIIQVAPDCSIITDGIVIHGTSEVDESMMTGESLPVTKRSGSIVIAGTANGPSTLMVKITRLPGDNTISDIATLVDSARFSRAKVQATVDKVCTYFVPCVLLVSLIVFAVWVGIGIHTRHEPVGKAVVTAITYAIAVLAISCPCAIGLAVPMVILVSSGVAAQKMGLVFKSAETIEEARKITHVVFDKTGTLTMGTLSVVDYQMFTIDSVDAGPAICALVASSKHPVARAVMAFLQDKCITVSPDVKDTEMVTGHGIRATLGGKPLHAGSPRWLSLETRAEVSCNLNKGYTMFCVTYNGELLALFSLTDTPRPEVPAVLASLRAQNIEISILSGDNAVAVHRVADGLGIPASHVRAHCLPVDKQTYIRELTDKGQKVLFCGDGTNDAVALAQATIGVHMSSGSMESNSGVAASAAADVVLLHPSLTGILSLISLSRSVYHRIVMNFTWSFVYNLVAVLFAAGAFVNARIAPAYAGLGEVVSVVPVVLGALSVKWVKEGRW